MTRTSTGRQRHSWRERAFVLGGFAVAALLTAIMALAGGDMEWASAAWLAAILWAAVSSLALALRRGFVHRDWSAFENHEFPDNGELIDWSTQTGQYAWMRVAEEHERLMRGD